MTNATIAENPLLIGKGLPPFQEITPDHVVPGMTQILQELETTFDTFLCSRTWTCAVPLWLVVNISTASIHWLSYTKQPELSTKQLSDLKLLVLYSPVARS